MNHWIAEYLKAQKAALDSIPIDAVAKLIDTFTQALRDDRQQRVPGRRPGQHAGQQIHGGPAQHAFETEIEQGHVMVLDGGAHRGGARRHQLAADHQAVEPDQVARPLPPGQARQHPLQALPHPDHPGLQEPGEGARPFRRDVPFQHPVQQRLEPRQERPAHQLEHQALGNLGRVAAGEPILAEQSGGETLEMGDMFGQTDELFALQVRGDSMINAGILEGDYVIVRRQDTARAGEIVVALIEDEATVKRYQPKRGRIELVAENPRYAPIVVQLAVNVIVAPTWSDSSISSQNRSPQGEGLTTFHSLP